MNNNENPIEDTLVALDNVQSFVEADNGFYQKVDKVLEGLAHIQKTLKSYEKNNELKTWVVGDDGKLKSF